MQKHSDAQLLRLYAGESSDAAFSEIVARHADLVYSAALRQLDSADLARDVAQSVFTDLAHKARPLAEKLPDNASLVGWLYRSTRFAALNQVRADRRRQSRERQVMENFNPASETSMEWERVRPVLDEAMAELRDEDREAVLLRYFKKHDLHEVGMALGVSEDAAQKRVSRAVERLREFFTKRGVTVGASGLAVVISANTVQAAPAGLAVTISMATLAGTTVTTSTVVAATTKTIAMTTLQKTLVTATVAVLAGVGIYEARQAAQLREQVQTLQQQQAPLVEQIQQLQNNLANATNRLANLIAENAELNTNPHQIELLKLRGEVTVLRNELIKMMTASQASNHDTATAAEAPHKRHAKLLMSYFEANPSARIPEMNLLSSEETYSTSIYGLAVKLAAQSDPANSGQQGMFDENRIELKTDEQYRRAASELRSYAEYSLAPMFCDALKAFLQANNGAYPTSVSEIQLFFTTPIDPAILQRYEIQPASIFSQIQSKYAAAARISGMVITSRAAIDEDFDHRIIIGPTNYMVGDAGSFSRPLKKGGI